MIRKLDRKQATRVSGLIDGHKQKDGPRASGREQVKRLLVADDSLVASRIQVRD